jgi:predicted ATP-grasp superfamily ATP-dependent carboligase
LVPVTIVGDPSSHEGWLLRTRFASTRNVGPLPDARDSWLACLSDLAQDRDGVLIPGSDRATEFVIRERPRIPQCLRSFEGPASAHQRLMHKASLYEWARNQGVRTPWTLQLRSRGELERAVEEATYPCLLKPVLSHQWRRLFGLRRVLFLRGPDDLLREAGPPLDAGLELLITEHVPGPDRNLEGAVTIRRADGTYVLAYGWTKPRQYPPGFGSGSLHESAEVPQTTALTKRLLDAAGFVGISAVEFKRHEETGDHVLIEVNVRVPQEFALGDVCGTDASWRLFATLAGIALPSQPRPVAGAKVVVPSLEPRAVAGSIANGGLSFRKLVASYRGVRSLSGLTWRDPGPIAWLTAHELARGARFIRDRSRRT